MDLPAHIDVAAAVRAAVAAAANPPGYNHDAAREVLRICKRLRWDEEYCVSHALNAAGLSVVNPDGKPYHWTVKQLNALLFLQGTQERWR
jgi:hypothetical protein